MECLSSVVLSCWQRAPRPTLPPQHRSRQCTMASEKSISWPLILAAVHSQDCNADHIAVMDTVISSHWPHLSQISLLIVNYLHLKHYKASKWLAYDSLVLHRTTDYRLWSLIVHNINATNWLTGIQLSDCHRVIVSSDRCKLYSARTNYKVDNWCSYLLAVDHTHQSSLLIICFLCEQTTLVH